MAFTRERAGEALLLFFASLPCNASQDFLAPLRDRPSLCPMPTAHAGWLFPSNIRDPVTSSSSPTRTVLDLPFIVPLLPLTLKESLLSRTFFRRPAVPQVAMPS